MIRRPPRSTLFPTRRSSDLRDRGYDPNHVAGNRPVRRSPHRGRGGGGRKGKPRPDRADGGARQDRKSTRLNSSHEWISYAVFCLKKKKRHMKEVKRQRRTR